MNPGHRRLLQSALRTPGDCQAQGRLVARSPEQLRLHPALVRLNLISSVVELSDACRLKGQPLREPILITTNGTIIPGFKDWHAAVTDALLSVNCIEYSLNDEEAIQFILVRHQQRRTWNHFSRIRLALELEQHFQSKALANQIAGGRYKGSANLPQAEHIDVRQEIADAAGVGARNVSNVKMILARADPRLIEGLHDGTLSIHRAVQWCNLSRRQQLERYTNYSVERAIGKVTRQAIAQLRAQTAAPDSMSVLAALQRQGARAPGSIAMRVSERERTLILIGQDLLKELHSQAELGLG